MVELLTTNQSNASTENDRFNLNGMRRIVNHCRDTMEKKLPDVLDLLMDAQATLRERALHESAKDESESDSANSVVISTALRLVSYATTDVASIMHFNEL